MILIITKPATVTEGVSGDIAGEVNLYNRK